MSTTLGNINIFVTNILHSKRFYTEVLGLTENTERSQPPAFFLLDAGGCTLTLQDSSTPGAAFEPGTSIELGFAVDNVEIIAEALQAWGVEASAVQQMGWGTAVDARDPDGHRLTIYKMR